MKIPIAEVRRRLPKGAMFTATRLQPRGNDKIPEVTRRVVISQSGVEMVTATRDLAVMAKYELDQHIYQSWRYATAELAENGDITVYMQHLSVTGQRDRYNVPTTPKVEPIGDPIPLLRISEIESG